MTQSGLHSFTHFCSRLNPRADLSDKDDISVSRQARFLLPCTYTLCLYVAGVGVITEITDIITAH